MSAFEKTKAGLEEAIQWVDDGNVMRQELLALVFKFNKDLQDLKEKFPEQDIDSALEKISLYIEEHK